MSSRGFSAAASCSARLSVVATLVGSNGAINIYLQFHGWQLKRANNFLAFTYKGIIIHLSRLSVSQRETTHCWVCRNTTPLCSRRVGCVAGTVQFALRTPLITSSFHIARSVVFSHNYTDTLFAPTTPLLKQLTNCQLPSYYRQGHRHYFSERYASVRLSSHISRYNARFYQQIHSNLMWSMNTTFTCYDVYSSWGHFFTQFLPRDACISSA